MKHEHDTNPAKIKETVQAYFTFIFSKIIRRHYLFRAEQFSFRNLFDFNILKWRIHRKFSNWNFHKHIEHMQAFYHLRTSPYISVHLLTTYIDLLKSFSVHSVSFIALAFSIQHTLLLRRSLRIFSILFVNRWNYYLEFSFHYVFMQNERTEWTCWQTDMQQSTNKKCKSKL